MFLSQTIYYRLNDFRGYDKKITAARKELKVVWRNRIS